MLAASLACDQHAPRVDSSALLRKAEEQVGNRLFAYPRHVLSGQIDSIMSFWAPDIRIAEDETRVDGDSALRAIGKEFFARFDVTRLAYAPTETVAHDTDSVVYQFGYFTEDTRRKGQMAVTNAGKNFGARWVRDASGHWRIQRFIATTAARPSAPTPTVAPIAPAGPTQPIDPAAIEQRMREYADVLRNSDPAAILGFWAEDGRYLAPATELNDKPAITRFVDQGYARRKPQTVDITSEEVFLHGAVAYQLGSCSPCLVPGSANRAHYYIARWKHSASGAWLIDRLLATPAPRVY